MSEDEAKRRFMILNLVRLIAVGLIVAGAANIGGHVLPTLSPELGYGLFFVGIVDFFAVPMLLRRQWRNRQP